MNAYKNIEDLFSSNEQRARIFGFILGHIYKLYYKKKPNGGFETLLNSIVFDYKITFRIIPYEFYLDLLKMVILSV